MKKSLAMLMAATVTSALLMACFMPFYDPQYFLLMIPVLIIIPHLDKFYAYLDKMME